MDKCVIYLINDNWYHCGIMCQKLYGMDKWLYIKVFYVMWLHWKQKIVNWQLCYHWWHHKLSLQQFTVPPVRAKLSNWLPFVFSVLIYAQYTCFWYKIKFKMKMCFIQNIYTYTEYLIYKQICHAWFCCGPINSLRPSDAYMRQWTNHHWFR